MRFLVLHSVSPSVNDLEYPCLGFIARIAARIECRDGGPYVFDRIGVIKRHPIVGGDEYPRMRFHVKTPEQRVVLQLLDLQLLAARR